MSVRPCPRCHTSLAIEDESALLYCFHCGAPQVLLHEELRLRDEELRSAAENGTALNEFSAANEDPSAVQWQPMLRIAAAVSACFSLFTMMLPPLALLVPVVTLSLYGSRIRSTRFNAGLGARIGLLCGLMLTSVTGLVGAVLSLVLRLRTHDLAAFDAAMNAQIAQLRTELLAQHAPDATAAIGWLSIPEFRTGLMLSGFGLMAVFLVIGITLAGALAGFARSRTTPRMGV